MSSNSLILRITHPDGSTRESVLEQESVILGSGPGAGLHVPDPKVSTLHLMLKVELNRVMAIDLGSEHGTSLGNELIRKPVSLSPGDVLRIGQSVVEVRFPQEPKAVVRPAHNAVRAMAPSANPVVVARALHPAQAPKRVLPRRQSRAREEKVWQLLAGPLPAEARPTPEDHVLQVSMVWQDQVIDVEHVLPGGAVTVGAAKSALFQLAGASTGNLFQLASFEAKGLSIHLPEGAQAVVDTAEGSARPVEPGASVLLSLQERARVQLEDVGFFFRFVRASEAARARLFTKETGFFVAVALGCLFLAGLSGLWLALQPRAQISASEALQNQVQYVRLITKPQPHLKAKAAHSDKQSSAEGEKAKEEEGKVGREDEKRAEADPSKGGQPNPDKRAKDLKRLHKMGLLGAVQNGSAASIFGQGGLGTGINSALGGLRAGAGTADAHGSGGVGARGSGVGGGGLGLNAGGIGTQGMGSGKSGYGSIDLGGKGKDTTRIIPGKTTVVGGLDRDVIAKIIRQHQSEIKYCFEVELQKNPSLSGKVGVTFIIDGSGDVSDDSIAETSLNNQNTEQCMLMKIKRWKFPNPVGGGVVTVNFPWVFKPAGGE